jgi:hypothetical protein
LVEESCQSWALAAIYIKYSSHPCAA